MDIRPFTENDFDAFCQWFPDEAALVRWGGPEVHLPLTQSQLTAMLAESEPIDDPRSDNRFVV